jgi:hypothetical protein
LLPLLSDFFGNVVVIDRLVFWIFHNAYGKASNSLNAIVCVLTDYNNIADCKNFVSEDTDNGKKQGLLSYIYQKNLTIPTEKVRFFK